MRRIDAEFLRERLQREDPDHQFLLREQPQNQWQVVRLDVRARRFAAFDPPGDLRPFLVRQVPPYGHAGVTQPAWAAGPVCLT